MLNELREYDQYTYPLDTKDQIRRLKHVTLCNDLSGTVRAMTMIARKSIFENRETEKISTVKNDLQVWCGDPEGNPETASDGISFAWLPQYITQILAQNYLSVIEGELKKYEPLDLPRYHEACGLYKEFAEIFCIDSLRQKKQREQLQNTFKALKSLCTSLSSQSHNTTINQRNLENAFASLRRLLDDAFIKLSRKYYSSGYNQAMFNEKPFKSSQNDYKSITYEKIIADAITAGPLKRYYLVCDTDDFTSISYKTPKGLKFPFEKEKKGWTKASDKKADWILKTTSAYLLEQCDRNADYPHIGLAPINWADIINWSVSADIGLSRKLEQFFINSRSLISREKLDNVALISIDFQWMDFCGWGIIEEDKLDLYLDEHPHAVFFSDHGCGEYLKRNERYE